MARKSTDGGRDGASSAASSTVAVGGGVSIPLRELSFTTSRASGPGGQNVNKVETRVTLRFEIDASSALNDDQKQRLRDRLATRVSKAGVLRIVSQKHRTQAANRRATLEKFARLADAALRPRRRRRRTSVPTAARRRRLENKRRRSELKRNRRRVNDER